MANTDSLDVLKQKLDDKRAELVGVYAELAPVQAELASKRTELEATQKEALDLERNKTEKVNQTIASLAPGKKISYQDEEFEVKELPSKENGNKFVIKGQGKTAKLTETQLRQAVETGYVFVQSQPLETFDLSTLSEKTRTAIADRKKARDMQDPTRIQQLLSDPYTIFRDDLENLKATTPRNKDQKRKRNDAVNNLREILSDIVKAREGLKTKSPSENVKETRPFKEILSSAAEYRTKEGSTTCEDYILQNDDLGLYSVFDGMGGHGEGEVASRMAAQYVLDNIEKIKSGLPIQEAGDLLAQIVQESGKQIYEIFKEKYTTHRPGTTGSVLKIHEDGEGKKWAIVANVGDSRIYKIKSTGEVEQITKDNPEADEKEEEIQKKLDNTNVSNIRQLDDIEKIMFRGRNIVTRALGIHFQLPEIHTFQIESGERFLITSDGIHDNLTTDEISGVVKKSHTIQGLASRLIREAVARSQSSTDLRAKNDDMSAVLVNIGTPEPIDKKRAELVAEIFQTLQVAKKEYAELAKELQEIRSRKLNRAFGEIFNNNK